MFPPTCRCTVINRAVLRLNPELEEIEWNTQLYTPPNIVSAQEKSQIEERMEGWVDNLVVSLYRPCWRSSKLSKAKKRYLVLLLGLGRIRA